MPLTHQKSSALKFGGKAFTHHRDLCDLGAQEQSFIFSPEHWFVRQTNSKQNAGKGTSWLDKKGNKTILRKNDNMYCIRVAFSTIHSQFFFYSLPNVKGI